MAKSAKSTSSRSIDQRVAALRGLDPTAAASLPILREALCSTNGYLVSLAAKVVGDHRLEALVPDLADAFTALVGADAAKRDPMCRGKIAIARALHDLDHWDDRVFVTGLRITQPEGFDGEDTAAPVRALCGLAHAHLLRTDAADILAELLADAHRTPRIAAAQGIGDLGRADLTALLRFKLLGDPDEPEVEIACLDSLLSMARESSIDFIARLLTAHDERAELAAIALGGTRDPRALEPLLHYSEGATPSTRQRTAYLALALLRLDAATAVLVDAIRTEGKADALAATRALATFKDDPAIVTLLREAVESRKDPALRRELESLLGG